MSTAIEEIHLCAEQYGWRFQEPFVNCLRLVVARRRRGCNETQKQFWMVAADEGQLREALNDALAIIELSK